MMARRWCLPAFLLLMLIVVYGAQAQTPPASSSAIAVGDMVRGEVSAANIAPSYFFRAETAQTMYLQVLPDESAFNPVVLVVNTADNTVLATLGGEQAGAELSTAINLPAAGQYFVQVQGAGGSTGAFTLALDDAPIPVPTPVAPTELHIEQTEVALPTPTLDMPAIDLPVGTAISGAVTTTNPQAIYRLSTGESPLLLTFAAQGDATLAWTITREEGTGQPLAEASGLPFASVVLPSGSTFQITLAFPREGNAATFAAYTLAALPYNPALITALLSEGETTVAAAPTDAVVIATNTPDAPPITVPTATITPTLAPSDIDLALRWSGTYFLITNVSGAPLDIHDLSFEGLNRRANADTWTQLGTVDVRSIPAGACVGFRPLAYPDAPPLASGCSDLAAWWVSDALAFWLAADSPTEQGTFAVFYNGQPLTTCYTRDGGCSVDMPNG